MHHNSSAFENSLSSSVHPCTLLDASFCSRKNIAAVWNYCHPWQFCISSAFENSDTGYKARAQINRRPVEKCTSVYTFQRRVFAAQKHRCCLEPLPSVAVLIRRGFSVAARKPRVLSRNKFDTGQTCVQRSTWTYFAERATK